MKTCIVCNRPPDDTPGQRVRLLVDNIWRLAEVDICPVCVDRIRYELRGIA